MLIDILLFIIGLTGLYFGAEWLVGGAARLAGALGISSFIVGLTLVSFGTSAPELVVSSLASFRDNGGLAVGNVLGSNVANIGLILGISAVIFPIRVDRELIVRDLPVMIGFALLIPLLGWSGAISRWEGATLLALFALYVTYLALAARRESAVVLELMKAHGTPPTERAVVLRDGAVAVVGLIVLAAGAHLLVRSAVDMATLLGVPELVVGLTMVAFGTSLPELAASVTAARRKEGQIVIGNIVGSNIFNVALVLGAAALVRPLPIPRSVVRLDAPIVIALSLVLVPLVYSRRRVDRYEGAALVAAYVAFIAWSAT